MLHRRITPVKRSKSRFERSRKPFFACRARKVRLLSFKWARFQFSYVPRWSTIWHVTRRRADSGTQAILGVSSCAPVSCVAFHHPATKQQDVSKPRMSALQWSEIKLNATDSKEDSPQARTYFSMVSAVWNSALAIMPGKFLTLRTEKPLPERSIPSAPLFLQVSHGHRLYIFGTQASGRVPTAVSEMTGADDAPLFAWAHRRFRRCQRPVQRSALL